MVNVFLSHYIELAIDIQYIPKVMFLTICTDVYKKEFIDERSDRKRASV